VLKIITIIKDVIEKNKIKTYLNRAKRKIKDIDFELVNEFDDNRKAVNYLYRNIDIDIIIVENRAGEIFSGLDLLMLAEKEFTKSSIMLLSETGKELALNYKNIDNLTAIFNKNDSYSSFANLLLLTMLKQKKKKDKLKKREEKLNDYRTIIDHTHDAIFLVKVDCDNNFYYKRINGTHQRLTALSNEEIQGKKINEIFSKEVAEKLEENYSKCLRKRSMVNYTEKLAFPAGKKIWQTTLYPVVRNGRVEEIVGASYDITDLEEKEQKLNYIKRYDRLTGLYNKEYFNQLFEELNQSNKDNLALILINVENFNLVNKFFSYQQGNKILKKIASILAKISGQDKIAAHLCADHFAVILKNQNSFEIDKTLSFIKEELAKININGIYIDTAAVSMLKMDDKITAHDFFSDGVSKINFNKYKESKESKFYNSLINYVEKNNYINLRHNDGLLKISKEIANHFDLNQNERIDFLLLARHYDLGKLTLNKNIVKKGEKLTTAEWHEYQKYVISSANFAAYYRDLAGICNLIYSHQEHFDGTGWPQGLKGEEIPYLSRLFAVVNFYSKLKSNIYFPLLKDKYYFGRLEKKEIVREFNRYRGNVFDPHIVDRFLSLLKSQSLVDK
jgi:diguanylate cyclase (GGDEF)-like protein/PAS domain S-box-containing protein